MITVRPALSVGLVAAIPFLAAGCLGGLGPGDPQPIHYYAAEAPPSDAAPAPDAAPIRLRRVVAAGHLRERIVWRASEVEYGFYELRRWTEKPVAYLERALVRELFERRAVPRTQSVMAFSLDVELIAFEEILRPEHEARVTLAVSLSDPSGLTRLQRTIDRRVPIDGTGASAVAEAMGRALAEAVGEAATAVLAVSDA